LNFKQTCIVGKLALGKRALGERSWYTFFNVSFGFPLKCNFQFFKLKKVQTDALLWFYSHGYKNRTLNSILWIKKTFGGKPMR